MSMTTPTIDVKIICECPCQRQFVFREMSALVQLTSDIGHSKASSISACLLVRVAGQTCFIGITIRVFTIASWPGAVPKRESSQITA